MILNPEALQDIDVAAEMLKPGQLTYAMPEVPAFKIRINGPNLDVSLAVCCPEDIEIIEKLLVKMRASLSPESNPKRGSPPFPEAEAAVGGGNSPYVSNAHSAVTATNWRIEMIEDGQKAAADGVLGLIGASSYLLGLKPWAECDAVEKIERLRSELDGWRRVCAELTERLQLFETHTHGTDGKLLVSLEQADRQRRMGQCQASFNTLG